MAKPQELNGHYFGSQYKCAFSAYLEAESCRYLSGNSMPHMVVAEKQSQDRLEDAQRGIGYVTEQV